MRTAHETLQIVQALGIELYAEGEHLRYKAPVGVMTLDLKRALKTHKETILALLTWNDDALVQLRQEIGKMAREEEEQWEVSHELDPRWPPSAQVYKRLRRKEVSLWERMDERPQDVAKVERP